jgi:hypothetical protein
MTLLTWTARMDRLVNKHTAFPNVLALLTDAQNYSYRPTLYTMAAKRARDRRELTEIADFYDGAMSAMGIDKKIHRV